jgi:beta-carotene hydroxylase
MPRARGKRRPRERSRRRTRSRSASAAKPKPATSKARTATAATAAATAAVGSPAKRFAIAPSLVKPPPVAWPTVLLFGCALTSHVMIGALAPVGDWFWAPLLAQTLTAYILFTPAHDAVHRSVVACSRFANDAIGWVSVLALFSAFPALRCVHNLHHKHTNDASRDPDMWAQRGPGWALPLRWFTQVEHYYRLYLSPRIMRTRSLVEVASVLTVVVALNVANVLCIAALVGGPLSAPIVPLDIAERVVWRWYVPSRLAIAFLSYSFDYLPHRPAQSRDPFGATLLIRGLARQLWPTADLVVPLLGQSDHVVHHLWPSIPFYRYRETYNRYKSEFDARIATTHVFESATPWGAFEK